MQYVIFPEFNEDEEKKKKVITQTQTSGKYSIFPELDQYKPPEQKPSQVAAEEQKQKKNIFQKIGEGVSNLFKPVVEKVKQYEVPPFKESLLYSAYLNFPSFFPNPDSPFKVKISTLGKETTPEQKDAIATFWKNPVDNSINAARDFLDYHPKVLNVLAEAQKIVEDFEYTDPITKKKIPVGFNKNPLFRGIVKGVSDTYLGSSQQVKDTFETRLNHPVTVEDKVYETVGQVVGQVMSYAAGGSALKSLGFAKATLPVLFATLGQTSAPSETTIEQRVEKIPVDIATGWLFSKVPAFKPGGLSLANLKTLAGGTTIIGAAGFGQGFLDALIMKKSKEDAIKMAATQAVVMALFHIVGSGMGLLSDEILNSKLKTGKTTFTPDEFRNVVNNSKFAGTKAGDALLKIADGATLKNQNIEFNMEAMQKTLVAKKLDLNKPEGINIGIRLVDKAPALPSEEITPLEVTKTGEVKTPVTPAPVAIETLGNEVTVFRGAKETMVDVSRANGITGGVSFSASKAVAERFATKTGGTVQQYTISPEAKVVNHSVLEDMTPAEVTKYLIDNKVDVVRFDVPEGAKGEAELRVVNDKVLKVSEVVPAEKPPLKPIIEGREAEKITKYDIKRLSNDTELTGLSGYTVGDVKNYAKSIISGLVKRLENKIIIKDMEVMGSRAGGTPKPTSDIDILVQYEGKIGEQRLSGMLGTSEFLADFEGKPINITVTKEPIAKWLSDSKKALEGVEKPITVASTDELLKYVDRVGHRTPEQIAKLRADIKTNGIQYPVELIINKDGTWEINDGKHRVLIAKDLGIKEIPVKVVRNEQIKPPKATPPSGKTDIQKIYNATTKKLAKNLPGLDVVEVKNGEAVFSSLEMQVKIKTDKPNGYYQVVGKDMVQNKELKEGEVDLPVFPEEPKEKVAQVLSEDFIKGLSKANKFKSDYETMPVLTGIELEFNKNKVRMISTDGFTLFNRSLGSRITTEGKFLLSNSNDIVSLSKIFGEGIVNIKEGKDSIYLTNDKASIVVKKNKNIFPDYEEIYPEFIKSLVVDKNSILQAVKELMPYAKESANIVRIQIKEGEMILTSEFEKEGKSLKKTVSVKIQSTKDIKTTGIVEGVLVMPIVIDEGKPPKGVFALNIKFLESATKVGESNETYISLPDKPDAKPTHFSDQEEESYGNILQPKPKSIEVSAKHKFSYEESANPILHAKSDIKRARRMMRENPARTEELTKFIKEAQDWIDKKEKLAEEESLQKTEPKKEISGYASIDKFAELKKVSESLGYFKPVEFPELVRMVRNITGEFPAIKFPRFRPTMGGRPSGLFVPRGKGKVILNPDIFTSPEEAVKTLAHEIGHLTDYLPEGLMKRGNLLGRLLTLERNMKQHFGDLKNQDVKDELLELSKVWRPFDEDKVSAGYLKYRNSPAELYADAISILFNDPQLLKSKAPIFWEKFFEYLDRKPLAKENLFATWDLLNKGEEAVFNERNKAMEESFKNAEDKFYMKELEKRKENTNLLYQLQVLFDNKNQAIINKVKQARKMGANVADAKNPMYEMQGLNYLDGVLKNYVADNFQPIFEKAQAIEGGWDKLGKILLLERVIYERGELANPGGFSPETAQTQLDQLKLHTDSKEWEILQEAKTKFREAVQNSLSDVEEADFYTPDLIEQMKANPAYATFQVVDYIDTYISSRAYRSVGTLKDVANPATSTVMKLISIKKAIERNKVKVDMKDLLQTTFKDEIEPAKTVYAGRRREFLEPKDPNKGLLITIEGGKPQGYYVDKEIARSFNYLSNDVFNMAVKTTRLISQSKFYRPLFTTINLGFQTFNLVRDFNRYWKNLPDYTFKDAILSFPRAFVRYAQAVPHAYKRVRDLPDEMVRTMENSKMLAMSFNDVFKEPIDAEDKQIERILQRAGVLEKPRRRKILKPLYWVLDGISGIGDFVESLPKIAGYIELKDKMPENEMAQFIRTKLGSPDFRVSGYATPITNNILLFSNAIKEGMKSDFQVATGKSEGGKQSQSGFWWKNAVSTVLPKFLMVMAALGLFGKWMKDRMDDASEYDKSNYTIVPLGVDENGKTVYLRIPNDETGRLIGGLTWKLANISLGKELKISDLQDLVAFGAGQFPNMTPSFTGIGATVDYLSGKNPYDSFRGRSIIPDTEFQAGTKYSFPIFAKWLAQNQGLGIFVPSYIEDNPTQLQKVLGLPIVSNIAGRWIKVSDYGRTEQNREIITQAKTEAAAKSLERRKLVDKYIKEYQKSDGGIFKRRELERKLVEEAGLSHPKNAGEKTSKAALVKKFQVGIVRGESDANMNSLIDVTTNDAKVDLLKSLKGTLSSGDYNSLIQTALKYKIISKDVLKESKK